MFTTWPPVSISSKPFITPTTNQIHVVHSQSSSKPSRSHSVTQPVTPQVARGWIPPLSTKGILQPSVFPLSTASCNLHCRTTPTEQSNLGPHQDYLRMVLPAYLCLILLHLVRALPLCTPVQVGLNKALACPKDPNADDSEAVKVVQTLIPKSWTACTDVCRNLEKRQQNNVFLYASNNGITMSKQDNEDNNESNESSDIPQSPSLSSHGTAGDIQFKPFLNTQNPLPTDNGTTVTFQWTTSGLCVISLILYQIGNGPRTHPSLDLLGFSLYIYVWS